MDPNIPISFEYRRSTRAVRDHLIHLAPQTHRVVSPQKVAERLKGYIRDKGIAPEERIFPIGYAAARVIVRNAGKRVGVRPSPHDLRRHVATYASRSGTPIEIVSKVILRHSNLSTIRCPNCTSARLEQ